MAILFLQLHLGRVKAAISALDGLLAAEKEANISAGRAEATRTAVPHEEWRYQLVLRRSKHELLARVQFRSLWVFGCSNLGGDLRCKPYNHMVLCGS